MEGLLPAERQQKILDILREEFTVRSSSLSERLDVSEMTIRRDFDALEQQGLVERTHGGAVFRQERVTGKFHYQSSLKENTGEKQRIAQRAATMIEPHDSIYLGEGATAAKIIRYAVPGMPFTIFTNNLGVAAEMKEGTGELIILGGSYNAATHALAGPLTMEMIRQVNASKVFLGADGLSLNVGLTTPNLEIAVIERSMIRHTRGQVIVMVDFHKIGRVAEMSIAPLKFIDVLITNRQLPESFQRELEALNVDVMVA